MLAPDRLGSGTYETISKALFEEYKQLKADPKEYSKKLESTSAQKEAATFRKGEVEWSEPLANIALHHVNYDGPCHYSIDSDGIDESEMFDKYMTWKKEAEIV